ncbi:hypothetical protein IWX50DRAFT_618088 [Phyllosticta citricarpa]|uniref:RING-type domain-containing protein n=1 Tax=Phyllosticta citricarpa TaxID=55181 RepID=A0ABR1M6S4_9PEZI
MRGRHYIVSHHLSVDCWPLSPTQFHDLIAQSTRTYFAQSTSSRSIRTSASPPPYGIRFPTVHRDVYQQYSATMDTEQGHFERVLEYDTSSIKVSEDYHLPKILHYIQLLPTAVPRDLSKLTHVDQVVSALSDEERIYLTTQKLDFGVFLDTELTDLRRGAIRAEVFPLITAKVLILASLFRISNIYSVRQHAAKLVELAERARLVTLAEPLVAVPYVDTVVGTISKGGDRCPICWEGYRVTAADEELLDDINCEEVQLAVTRCGHVMCIECLQTWANESGACPLCRGVL